MFMLRCCQVAAGVRGCEVCDQHNKGEQEEPTGTTAAPRLQPPGRNTQGHISFSADAFTVIFEKKKLK